MAAQFIKMNCASVPLTGPLSPTKPEGKERSLLQSTFIEILFQMRMFLKNNSRLLTYFRQHNSFALGVKRIFLRL